MLSPALPCPLCPFPSILSFGDNLKPSTTQQDIHLNVFPSKSSVSYGFNLLGLLKLLLEQGRVMPHKAKILKLYTKNSNELVYNKKEPLYLWIIFKTISEHSTWMTSKAGTATSCFLEHKFCKESGSKNHFMPNISSIVSDSA